MIEYIVKNIMLIAASLIIIVLAYFYISFLRGRIDYLQRDNVVLKVSIQEQQKTIDSIKKDYDIILKSRDDINKKVIELEKSNDVLKEKLFRENNGKTSIEDLILLDKKGRVVKIINSATNRVFRCFEIITGSELNPNEGGC